MPDIRLDALYPKILYSLLSNTSLPDKSVLFTTENAKKVIFCLFLQFTLLLKYIRMKIGKKLNIT